MYAKIENDILIFPPKNSGNMMNVDKNIQWLTENGYTDMSAEEIAEYGQSLERDLTNFNNVCQIFKSVCHQIGTFIGNPDFKGGFDEYTEFITAEATQENPAQASLLASMWSGANEYAKYEGEKIGLGQPDWWYKCWEEEQN